MRNIKKFISLTLLAATPIVLFFAIYVWFDPFCSLWRNPLLCPRQNLVNRSLLSTEVYLLNHKTQGYDSFIFGSSISGFFSIEAWKKHLPAHASAMHFDASSETLQGIAQKIDFIIRQGGNLRNALIVIEEPMLHRSQHSIYHLYTPDPRLNGGGLHWIEFQHVNFTAFRQIDFMKEYFLEKEEPTHAKPTSPLNLIINEYDYAALEQYVTRQADNYYTPQLLQKFEENAPLFPQPHAAVEASNLHWLEYIATRLHQLRCNFAVIVLPTYRGFMLDCLTAQLMRSWFGKERVFDFTHDEWLKNNPRHYYDPVSHLRTPLCNQILQEVYAKPNPGLLYLTLPQE